MSMLRNVLTYMGLGPDEAYDDDYLYEAEGPEREIDDEIEAERRTPRRQRDRPADGRRGERAGGSEHRPEPERHVPADLAPPRRRQREGQPAARPPLRAVPATAAGLPDDGVTVRPVPPPPGPAGTPAPPRQLAKPRPLAPRSFGDAKILADEFKRSVPVIMNLQGVDRDLARRLIDFASGVCYALDGSMEKIASQVFLLTPQAVEVSEEDRRRIDPRR
jgi:cell division inhibitor SepF